MNFDMFSSKQDDCMDPNYIYPMPYIDPMMYANPGMMNGNPYANGKMDPNMAMGGYIAYMNPFMANHNMPQQEQTDEDYVDMEEYMNNQCNQMQNMPGMMPGIPPQMMMPGMMPMMPPQMMMQMMKGMQGMMPPQMMQMMNPQMMMQMMQGMPQIHIDEFDEEEM